MGNLLRCMNTKKKLDKQEGSTSKQSSSSSSKEKGTASERAKDNDSSSSEESDTTSSKTLTIKLLLLGAGEAGKSTTYMIIRKETIDMFTDESDLMEFKDSIHENVIETMKTVIKKCYEFKVYHDDELGEVDCRINENLRDEVDKLIAWETEELNSEAVDAIESLKEDEGFMNCLLKLKHLYSIPDGATYFLNKISEIWGEGYVPSFEDVIHCRDRTTGVTHEELPFNLDGKKITLDLYDVGGQRAERRAWRLIFKNVDVIIFVFAVSEYDQKCIEDQATNRMVESLSVLNVLNEAEVFKKTPILLILTKIDLLEEKLKEGKKFNLPPVENFPDIKLTPYEPYTGGNNIEEVKQYILDVCNLQIRGEKAVITSFKNLMSPDIDFTKDLKAVLRRVPILKREE